MKNNINAKNIAFKQLFAFMIDFTIVVIPLVVFSSMDSLVGLYVFGFLWYFYIPFCEYYFNQTLGMKVLNTNIYGTSNGKLSKLSIGAVLRRQIARVSILWGLLGWLFLLFGKQLGDDYVVVYNHSHSTNIKNHPEISEFGYRFSFAVIAKILFGFLAINILIAIISIVGFNIKDLY